MSNCDANFSFTCPRLIKHGNGKSHVLSMLFPVNPHFPSFSHILPWFPHSFSHHLGLRALHITQETGRLFSPCQCTGAMPPFRVKLRIFGTRRLHYVSLNVSTPKWMVNDGKSNEKWVIWGYPHLILTWMVHMDWHSPLFTIKESISCLWCIAICAPLQFSKPWLCLLVHHPPVMLG